MEIADKGCCCLRVAVSWGGGGGGIRFWVSVLESAARERARFMDVGIPEMKNIKIVLDTYCWIWLTLAAEEVVVWVDPPFELDLPAVIAYNLLCRLTYLEK